MWQERSRVCRGRPKSNSPRTKTRISQGQPTHVLEHNPDHSPGTSNQTNQPAKAYPLFTLPGNGKPIKVNVKINGFELPMEVDTGASYSIISESTYYSLQTLPELKPTDIILHTYTGENIVILGLVDVDVSYDDKQFTLPLLVVQGSGPSLFGRNWLQQVKLNWSSINAVFFQSKLDTLLEKHASLFRSELGCLNNFTAKLFVDPQAKPRFFKPRPVPYLLKEKVQKEIQRLQELNILSPVTFSEWAAPIVPVLKTDGTLRLCGDYKITVNKALQPDPYPLPRVEDLFAALTGGVIFSKLDLSHAYQQIRLHEDSKKFTTISTQQGLFQYERLPFGIKTAPAVFQRSMETLLGDLPHVCVYIDDILVTGTDEQNHLHNLDLVLQRLASAGLTLKKSKCIFTANSVEYFGHVIDKNGLHPSQSKVQAIKQAPQPTNVTELKSFLGLVNYYHKFLPNLSTSLAPLHSLLRKNSRWNWSKEHSDTFNQVKNLLQSSSLLVHYNSSKPLLLACDASPYGIGAVLSHRMDDGSEKPITFISRTLAPAEKNYSQLEKEALAIIFAVKRLHHYLYGRHFTIYSDHQPLKYIFNENKPIPAMSSSRVQRWALTLSAYDYSIQYKPGTYMSNADALSRLPLKETIEHVPTPGNLLLLFSQLSKQILSAEHIKLCTEKDPVLARVRKIIQSDGEIPETEAEFRPYSQKVTELSVVDGILLWGSRVVIPHSVQDVILKQLHETHPGVSKMKNLARSYVWWPGIDRDIENTVSKCNTCQMHQPVPPQPPIHPWEYPNRPWARVHVDHTGPLVDAHSKWLEVHIVSSTSSSVTIDKLRDIFAIHGIPEQLVSDNGSAFTSNEFRAFMENNGINHTLTSPYHPRSNGLAERAVQTFKQAIKKMDGSLESKISKFLFSYRITPQSTTGLAPAEILLGRRPRSRFDLLHPDIYKKVKDKQDKVSQTNRRAVRKFSIGDTLFARNYSGRIKWIPVTVIKITGPVSYRVQTTSGNVIKRHVDQLRFRHAEDKVMDSSDDFEDLFEDWKITTPPHLVQSQAPVEARQTNSTNRSETLRCSNRVRRPVTTYAPLVSN